MLTYQSDPLVLAAVVVCCKPRSGKCDLTWATQDRGQDVWWGMTHVSTTRISTQGRCRSRASWKCYDGCDLTRGMEGQTCYPEQTAGKCKLRLVSCRIQDLVMAIHPGQYPGYATLVKPHFPLLGLPHTTTTASTSGLLGYVNIQVGITLCYHYYHCTNTVEQSITCCSTCLAIADGVLVSRAP